MLKLLIAPLRWLGRLLMALLILFEEWGWVPLQRFMAWLAQWPPLKWLEDRIRALRPKPALVVLALPFLLAIPVKLLAVWLMASGRALLGLLLILSVKFGGTALLARLFHLTQPALMALPWFARLYGRWTAWKQGVLDWLHGTLLWRQARAIKRQLKQVFKRWRQQWRALMHGGASS